MIQIDGSQGEGGGQILRSSLALSMATGRPFRIVKIRAGRAKPGLMRQHLTCVLAAAEVCSAEVIGASVGSQEITFVPGVVRAGNYQFAIGTAGGTTLVLQAVLPALLRAVGPSVISVEGGTHNASAPPFEFFARALAPLLERAGVRIGARLERHGFYPAGGGRVVVDVEPVRAPRGVEVMERGERRSIRARALVSRLPASIGRRELDVLRNRVGIAEEHLEIVEVSEPLGPGNAAMVVMEHDHVTEVFSGVGAVGKSAEGVARGISEEAREYVRAGRAVGPYLADQLMVPLAALGGGRYSTGQLSSHARTNMETIRAFGGVVEEEGGEVRVEAIKA